MRKRNPDSPWNPTNPIDVSPEEYESQVVTWLKKAGQQLKQCEVNHLEHIAGSGGDYEIDATVKFTILNGAEVIVLVECKRYSKQVKRDQVMTLWAKLQDVNAHKAMMFSTSGFQSGALKFAKSKNIATVLFSNGEFVYETKGLNTQAVPPPWVNASRYIGIITTSIDQKIDCKLIDDERIEPLSDWLFNI